VGRSLVTSYVAGRPSRYWPPFADLYKDRGSPFLLSHGVGACVYDVDGKEYVDATAGLWYAMVGHGRQELADAAHGQMSRLAGYYTHGDFANVPVLELAERVCGLAPLIDPLVMFNSGGGDAIDTAAKLVWRYWKVVGKPEKRVLMYREGAYHGMQGLGTSLGGIAALRSGYVQGALPLFEPLPANDVSAMEERISRLGAERIGAFFAEPVIGAGGVVPPAAGYFDEIQRICRQNDILFVADEVVTAFGRLGAWFGSTVYGLEPDLVCVAKGITSGYAPLGGVLAARHVWEPIAAGGARTMFRHGYTYAGHPTACAVALANLDIFEREELLARSASLAAGFDEALRTLESHHAVRALRTAGLMAGIDLDTMAFGDGFPAHVVRRARERGVLVRAMFEGTLQVSPPLIITHKQIQRIVDALGGAIDDAARAADGVEKSKPEGRLRRTV
jgi:putrescine---pyruvate transaminase